MIWAACLEHTKFTSHTKRRKEDGKNNWSKHIGLQVPRNVVSWMMGKVHSIRGWLWCVDVCSGTWKVKKWCSLTIKMMKTRTYFDFVWDSFFSHHCVVSFSFKSFGGLQKKAREWWMLWVFVFDDIWWSTQQKSATKTRKQRGKNARSLKKFGFMRHQSLCSLLPFFPCTHIHTVCFYISTLFLSRCSQRDISLKVWILLVWFSDSSSSRCLRSRAFSDLFSQLTETDFEVVLAKPIMMKANQ